MRAPNGRLSVDGSVQARRSGGIRVQLPPKSFLCPSNFVVVRKICLKHDKNKNIFPKYVDLSCPQTLKPGYGSGSAKIVSASRIFSFEGHPASRCSITFF